jgi:hypothetical protein
VPKIDLRPAQLTKLSGAEAVAICEQDRRSVPGTVASALFVQCRSAAQPLPPSDTPAPGMLRWASAAVFGLLCSAQPRSSLNSSVFAGFARGECSYLWKNANTPRCCRRAWRSQPQREPHGLRPFSKVTLCPPALNQRRRLVRQLGVSGEVLVGHDRNLSWLNSVTLIPRLRSSAFVFLIAICCIKVHTPVINLILSVASYLPSGLVVICITSLLNAAQSLSRR